MKTIPETLTRSQLEHGEKFKRMNLHVLQGNDSHLFKTETAPGLWVISLKPDNVSWDKPGHYETTLMGTVVCQGHKYYAFWAGTDPETRFLGEYYNLSMASHAISVAFLG